MAGGEVIPGMVHNAALRRARVVELRDQGEKFADIAKEVGVSLGQAWHDYERACRERPDTAVDQHRKNVQRRIDAQLERIDMEREMIADIILRPHLMFDIKGNAILFQGRYYQDTAPIMAAIKTMVQLDDQEAKLLGLNAATKVQADVTVNFKIDGVDMKALT